MIFLGIAFLLVIIFLLLFDISGKEIKVREQCCVKAWGIWGNNVCKWDANENLVSQEEVDESYNACLDEAAVKP